MSDCVVTAVTVALLQFYFTDTVLKKKHFMDVPKSVDNLIYLLNNVEDMSEK